MRIVILILLIGTTYLDKVESEKLETIAQWSLLNWQLPYDTGFTAAFRPENVVATGLEISWHRVFVATPRLKAGIPATLSYFPRNVSPGSNPRLQAYPSWEWHAAGNGDFNCSGIISVYRIRADRCNRLWVVDAGVNTAIDDFQAVCPPKLLVFDLQTDQLVRQIEFPREVLRPNSLLTNLAIDDTTATTCDDVFIYMTDTLGPGLLVFDGATDRSWRVLHASMFPDPDYSAFQIGSDNFEFFDGIVGLTFAPKQGLLYYQPLASDRLFSVATSELRFGPPAFGKQIKANLVGRKSSQALAVAVDHRDDTLLFAPMSETALASWNPTTNEQKVLAFSPEKLQFVAEIMSVDRDNGNIWLLSSRFHKFFLRRVNPKDINIRIMRIKRELTPFYQSDLSSYNFFNNSVLQQH